MSVNKVFILGLCGAEPEIREVGGKKNATFRVATSEKFKDREGKFREATDWHNIVAWDVTAGVAEKYVHKGSCVFVEGKVKYRQWTDTQGVKRYTTEISAERIQTVGKNESKPREERQGGDEDFEF